MTNLHKQQETRPQPPCVIGSPLILAVGLRPARRMQCSASAGPTAPRPSARLVMSAICG
jgi:hypothetical protein